MMIQSIGALQTYSVLANGKAKTTMMDSSGTSVTDAALAKITAIANGAVEETPKAKTDSLNLSLAGVTAYANQTLRDSTVAELNKLLKQLDGNAKPIEELDPQAHTPEKTADFIVSMSTGFFDTYAAGHPELEQKGLLDGFMGIISGGIERGFTEARSLLEGLDVLNGEIEEGVDSTDTQVWKKLQQFYMDKLDLLN